MRIAIIGFQNSGKTTVFNALTGHNAQTSAYGGGSATFNQMIVKVPDPRLDQLSELFKPKKHTPATVQYVDLAGIARTESGANRQGLGEKQLNEIATADALLAVVREFRDLSDTDPDVESEVESISLELVLTDLGRVENRLERLPKQIARAGGGDERKQLEIEQEALKRVKTALEEGRPARGVEVTEDELRRLRGFQLLTMKPLMVLLNAGEEEWEARKDQKIELAALKDQPETMATRLCGQMEMEIAQLPPEERAEFLESYGIEEPAANRVIRLCYELLGRISFFTVGADECRAWTVARETPARQAAGTIHGDLERGFIRAEVIGWEELITHGSMAEAKRHGLLRLEGKTYLVRDGDIMHVLFSV